MSSCVFGSFFVIGIMFEKAPLEISRDPCIESIICTTEDVGRVVIHDVCRVVAYAPEIRVQN